MGELINPTLIICAIYFLGRHEIPRVSSLFHYAARLLRAARSRNLQRQRQCLAIPQGSNANVSTEGWRANISSPLTPSTACVICGFSEHTRISVRVSFSQVAYVCPHNSRVNNDSLNATRRADARDRSYIQPRIDSRNGAKQYFRRCEKLSYFTEHICAFHLAFSCKCTPRF